MERPAHVTGFRLRIARPRDFERALRVDLTPGPNDGIDLRNAVQAALDGRDGRCFLRRNIGRQVAEAARILRFGHDRRR